MAYTSHHCRKGTAYVAVLGASLIVTVIGLSALTAVRVERRSAQTEHDFTRARLYAQAAIDLGLLWMTQDSDWRTNRTNGDWVLDAPFDRGTLSIAAADPTDGDLANDEKDPVTLTGTGIVGDARYMLEATIEPTPGPLECLQYALHAADEIEIHGGKTLQIGTGTVSTNGNLRNDGMIYGNASAASRSGDGLISGSIDVPAPAKRFPDPDVFDAYIRRATPAPFTGNIERQVWGPGFTPSGATNTNGVYVIDTAGHDLEIKWTRINGTLIVRCPGKKVILRETLLLHTYCDTYPALIVDGNIEMDFNGSGYGLSEASVGVNFNPPSASYRGYADYDRFDWYPSQINGLVHATGEIKMKKTAKVCGGVISETNVHIEGNIVIEHSPELYENPPVDYLDPVANLSIVPGSWQQVTLP